MSRRTPSSPPARIVMVCTGNICRSPAMHYWAAREWGDAAEVTSAGIYAEIGMDADRAMRAAARRQGLEIPRHRPTQLDRGILTRADLVLVATEQHARWAQREWGERAPHVFLLKEAVTLSQRADAPAGSTSADTLRGMAAALDAARLDEPAPLTSLDDPWGLDTGTFDRVMTEIVDGLAALTHWAGITVDDGAAHKAAPRG